MLFEDNIAAAVCLLMVCIPGVFFNLLGIATVLRSPFLRNAFGYLCLSHASVNAGLCFTFIVWCVPLTLWDVGPIAEGTLAKKIGQICTFFWMTSVYSHLAVSLNRLICITFPAKDFFTRWNTRILVASPWILAFCHIIPYFWDSECFIMYETDVLLWNYARTECGQIWISYYLDYYLGMTILGLSLAMDAVTLYQLRKANKMNIGLRTDKGKRRKMEIKFFIQSLCQTFIFLLQDLNSYYISFLFETPFLIFLTTTISWCACHALDGVILVYFQCKLRYLCPSANPKVQTEAITVSHASV